MTKWEYKYERVGHLSEKLLNEFGESGWELVTIFQRPDCIDLYFKRLVKEESNGKNN